MLYPKEDRITNKLMFACRTCQFSEEAQSSCVFRNNLYNTVGETAGVTQDVGSDPTVCAFSFGGIEGVEEVCCVLCGCEIGGEEGWGGGDERGGLGMVDVMRLAEEGDNDEEETEGEDEEEREAEAKEIALNNTTAQQPSPPSDVPFSTTKDPQPSH